VVLSVAAAVVVVMRVEMEMQMGMVMVTAAAVDWREGVARGARSRVARSGMTVPVGLMLRRRGGVRRRRSVGREECRQPGVLFH
jgi:F0F1-type ATP synthase beta subunit